MPVSRMTLSSREFPTLTGSITLFLIRLKGISIFLTRDDVVVRTCDSHDITDSDSMARITRMLTDMRCGFTIHYCNDKMVHCKPVACTGYQATRASGSGYQGHRISGAKHILIFLILIIPIPHDCPYRLYRVCRDKSVEVRTDSGLKCEVIGIKWELQSFVSKGMKRQEKACEAVDT